MTLSRLSLAAVLMATIACHASQDDPETGPAADNANRPQLTAAQAKAYSYAEVLKYAGSAGHEIVDPWDPLSDSLASNATPKPDYIVDSAATEENTGVFHTIQAAVSKAVADNMVPGKQTRHRICILVKPGVYHELLYVPAANFPITIYGSDTDARHTIVSANLDASISGADYTRHFGAQFAVTDPGITAMYASLKDKTILDTIGTATAWIRNNGFQARNITFENSYNKDPGDAKPDCAMAGCKPTMVNGQMKIVHHQAVAVMVDGADKVQFENVRFIGNQDTLYLKSSETGVTARSFFHNSYVEGDVDFIFGDTTAYFYQSEIKSLSDRPASYATAPNTSYQTRYGFVFDACKFTNDGTPSALAGKFYLGRQWFHSQKCTPYGTMNVPGYACNVGASNAYSMPTGTISKEVLETVGKVAILNSQIGAHINKAHPWSDWNANGSLPYRPVQYNSDDYWANLITARIDPVLQLGYRARKTPADPFLVEFNNTDE